VVVREPAGGGGSAEDAEVVVIVPTRRAADGSTVLGLPKGHLDAGETPEQAARREVREETGVEADFVTFLGEVRYWYARAGRRVPKAVTFYLFRYRAGEIEDHDDEVEDARWMPIEQAARELTYDGERAIVARALSRLRADR
jgi:mutator protein MutT